MGTCAKTTILLLFLLYFDPFIGKVKGLDSSSANPVNSAISKDMIEAEVRKLKQEVDTTKDYNPVIPNPKHEPPPRGKPGTSSAGGGR